MHHQIKAVIATLRKPSAHEVAFNLTAGQHTPLGHILRRMYQFRVEETLDSANRTGYPYNGGQHTFRFCGRFHDGVQFLELLKEVLSEKAMFNEEERQVLSELSFVSQEILLMRREDRLAKEKSK